MSGEREPRVPLREIREMHARLDREMLPAYEQSWYDAVGWLLKSLERAHLCIEALIAPPEDTVVEIVERANDRWADLPVPSFVMTRPGRRGEAGESGESGGID